MPSCGGTLEFWKTQWGTAKLAEHCAQDTVNQPREHNMDNVV